MTCRYSSAVRGLRKATSKVAKIAVTGKFRNNGQVCISPSRFFVHKDVQKKFTEVAVETARALKLGNGLEPGVEIGPMFEKSHPGSPGAHPLPRYASCF
mgnify:CR=1 FL=1